MSDLNEKKNAYIVTMSLAKSMLEKGIINEEEYNKIDTIMLKKYDLNSCTLCL